MNPCRGHLQTLTVSCGCVTNQRGWRANHFYDPLARGYVEKREGKAFVSSVCRGLKHCIQLRWLRNLIPWGMQFLNSRIWWSKEKTSGSIFCTSLTLWAFFLTCWPLYGGVTKIPYWSSLYLVRQYETRHGWKHIMLLFNTNFFFAEANSVLLSSTGRDNIH